MNEAEFRLLDEIEESHFWFVGKREILRSFLGRYSPGNRMLDMGCGTGGVLRDWRKDTTCVGVDRSSLALQICAKQGFNVLARADLTKLPFRNKCFDTILLLDVIEHLEDDVGFLREASEICNDSGRIVIAVPAYQLLWSQHDETFQHYRRYSARQLEAVVRAAGLRPVALTFTNSLLFPVAAVWRLLSYRAGLGRFSPRHDFWPIPRWLNAILASVYALESWLLRYINLPFGLSVLCIAEKLKDPADCSLEARVNRSTSGGSRD